MCVSNLHPTKTQSHPTLVQIRAPKKRSYTGDILSLVCTRRLLYVELLHLPWAIHHSEFVIKQPMFVWMFELIDVPCTATIFVTMVPGALDDVRIHVVHRIHKSVMCLCRRFPFSLQRHFKS